MNKENTEYYILSRVKNEKHAIKYWDKFGPSFGWNDFTIYGGPEMSFKNYTSYCKGVSSYKQQIRETGDKFSVEEYEIFQINA